MDKPDDVDECAECNADCLAEAATQSVQENECLPAAEAIICGPNPNTTQCCFIVDAPEQVCLFTD